MWSHLHIRRIVPKDKQAEITPPPPPPQLLHCFYKAKCTWILVGFYWLLTIVLLNSDISFFLAHLSHWLRVSYCDHWMSVVCRPSYVVRRQQLLQTTSPKLLAGFWPNLEGMILIWPSFKIVQMVLVHCISRSHKLKIDFQDENFKNLLWNHKA